MHYNACINSIWCLFLLYIHKLTHKILDKNVSRSFFQTITADHYVLSGDGRHHNPEKATLIMLEEATAGIHDAFTIHLTYKKRLHNLEEKLDQFIEGKNQRGRKFEVKFINASKNSKIIDLFEGVDY